MRQWHAFANYIILMETDFFGVNIYITIVHRPKLSYFLAMDNVINQINIETNVRQYKLYWAITATFFSALKFFIFKCIN